MTVERNYVAEVLADLRAGETPNLATAERAEAEIDRLKALNADLLAELEAFVSRWSKCPKKPTGRDLEIYLDQARAAIAKAKGAAP